MRYSQYFIPTLKETPADAEVISHQLMLRSGMIRKVASGIYNYLPLGLRTIRKVEKIVRAEMDRAGAIEIELHQDTALLGDAFDARSAPHAIPPHQSAA